MNRKRPAGKTVRVRAAGPDDLDALVRFSAAMALETEGRRLDQGRLRKGIAAVIDSPARGFYKVAETEHRASPEVVGQLLITFEWSDWRNATFWWIQSVYVDPAWRRHGIYRTMHQAVLDDARRRGGICGVRLYVEGDNAVAKSVYKKVGLSASRYHVFEDDFVLAKHPSRRRTARARRVKHRGRTV